MLFLSESITLTGLPTETSNRKLDMKMDHFKDNTATKKILTIFTTFSLNLKKKYIFENTVKIWHLFKKFAFLSLYCDNLACIKTWANLTEKYGWDIHSIPKSNNLGIPLLNYMYLDAASKYNSTFYAYCNGDIIFDDSLFKSLQSLEMFAKTKEPLLIIGQRSNFHVHGKSTFNNINEVTMAYKKSVLFTPWGEDYFIYTKNAVNWTNIPDVIVGK